MRNKFIIGLFLSIFIVLQIWCSSTILIYPYNGIYLSINDQQQWVISELDQDGAASKMDIQVGDKVLLVDGQPPELNPSVMKWRVIEKAKSIQVERNDTSQDIRIGKKSDITYDVVPLVEELVCLFMAGYLLKNLRTSGAARLLAMVFLNMAMIYMSRGASVRGDIVGKIMIVDFLMLMPVIFFHFLIVFFKEKGKIEWSSRILKYLYAVVLMAAAIRILYLYPPLTYTLYHYDGVFSLSFFIIGFLLNMSMLTILYVKVRNEQSYMSSIIKSVWLSLAISFLPLICFSILPQILIGQRIINAVFTSGLILIFPISFAYLIASNQLFDIQLIFRRLLFAALLAIAPVSIFTGIFVFSFRDNTTEKEVLFIFIGSLSLVSIVLYAMEYLTTRLEPFLFPRKYILQSALKKISKNLGTISSFRELKEIILVDIVNTLQVMGGAIVFQYKDGAEIICEGDIDEAEIEQLLYSSALMGHPLYSCMEMNRNEEYTSYLVMTRKRTHTLLGREELQWLSLITSYLEVSMENVYLIRKLKVRLQQLASQLPTETTAQDVQWFRKIMFELQEEERIRIASDLHDTTMQDLFFLKRKLAALNEKNNEHRDQVDQLVNFVEMINASLRQSCFELNPHLLKEIGLTQTVKMFLEKEAYATPFTLAFSAEQALPPRTMDLPTQRHIFRIIQELLNNAKKHSQASKVTFKMVETPHSLRLIYEDDGIGFDVNEIRMKEIGESGMGMEQIRSRILHLDGEFEQMEGTGKGAKLIITVPHKEVISA